ncbi:MAG: hypothetical protein QOH54_2628 [Mycobacterium sp.]|nr:hypothetical protein [Mycobacterium sp.]
MLFCLDVLERCLESEKQTLDNLVAVTVYATAMPALVATAEIFAKRFGAAPPSSTWVGVTELAHPDQLVEITATAVDLNVGQPGAVRRTWVRSADSGGPAHGSYPETMAALRPDSRRSA